MNITLPNYHRSVSPLKKFLIWVLVSSSLASYAVEGGKVFFYGVSILALFILFLLVKSYRIRAPARLVFAVSFVSFIFTMLSLLKAEITSVSIMMQTLMYPLVFMLISSVFSPAEDRRALQEVFLNTVLVLGFLNALFSFLNIALGSLTLPLLGELERGRSIFFLDVKSASGLLSNENYYSAVQALSFWCGFIVLNCSQYKRIMLAVIALSVFTGASRSVSAIFLLSLFFYMYLFWVRRRAAKIVLLLLSFIAVVLLLPQTSAILQDEEVNQALRIYKGFNSRDVIWDASLEVIRENFWLGVGDIEVSSRELLEAGSTNSTSQNSLLSMLVRVGVLGSLYMIAFYLVGLWQAGRITLSRISRSEYCVAATFVIFLFDGFFRSYSVGGIGLIPLIGVVSWVCLLDVRKKSA